MHFALQALVSEGNFHVVVWEERDRVSTLDWTGLADWIRALVNPLKGHVRWVSAGNIAQGSVVLWEGGEMGEVVSQSRIADKVSTDTWGGC